ncbi:hypothetical protein AE618_02230 [Bosea vaviloviae]|uniref:Uncharacterized protein n=1 Tax=Bosea vaviloviae TaxID=1526658 RepID=A0A0N1N554_9HYPH|nr:hypothetical protein AE618_02230 [Bosea vaviloviae]
MEILGLFGAGKTTLAAKLAKGFCDHLAEDHTRNPFWGNDEVLEVSGPLPYDLAFLLQHWHAAAQPPVGEPRLGICDWSFASDRLWASMRSEGDMAAYDAVHRNRLAQLGEPVGYLYLRHPVDVVASRLVNRGRQVEAPLLRTLEEASRGLDRLAEELPTSRVLVCGDGFEQRDLRAALSVWLGAKA